MRLALLTAALLALMPPSSGRAQSDYVVLPMLRADQRIEELEPLRAKVQAALVERGLVYVEPVQASRAFRESAQGSREPAAVSAEEQGDFERLAREASRGRSTSSSIASATVLSDMEQLRAMLERAPEVFNTSERKPATLGACIGAASLLLSAMRREDARELAAWCLYMLDLDVQQNLAPPLLMPLFREADQMLLERERAGALEVIVTPETCVPYVNGDSEPGRAVRVRRRYRLQAVCPDGRRSRMHDIVLGTGATVVNVDVPFDNAVHVAAGGLYIQTEVPELERRFVLAALRALHVPMAITISMAAGQAQLGYEDKGAVRRVLLSSSHTNESLSQAVRRLLESTSTPLAAGSQEAADSRESHEFAASAAVERADPKAQRRWQLALGGIAIGIGVGSFVAAGVFTTKRRESGDRVRAAGDTQYESLLGKWQDTRAKPYALGALGAVAVTSGIVGVLLSEDGDALPRWSVAVAGFVGVGLATWGLVDVARGASCDDAVGTQKACSRDLERRDLGALLVLSSAPLLAVPLTHWIGRALSTSLSSAHVVVTPQVNPLQRAFFLGARAHWL